MYNSIISMLTVIQIGYIGIIIISDQNYFDFHFIIE